MKQYFFCLCFLGAVVAFDCNAQKRELKDSTARTSPKGTTAIPLNKVYVGMDNLYHYAGLPSKNVIGKINDKTVEQGRDYFIIHIQQPGSYRIEIYDNSNSTPKLISSEYLDAVDMPDPVAAVSGKSSGFISTKELISSDSLSVLAKDARKQNSYNILFFRMTIKDAQFGLLEFESKGNHLSTEMKQAISRLGNGAAVSFENIKALLRVRGAGISVSLSSLNFIVEK